MQISAFSIHCQVINIQMYMLNNVMVFRGRSISLQAMAVCRALFLPSFFSGGVQLNIDAELLLNKAALVTIRVCNVKGFVELKFTKEPFSHWSLSLLPVSDAAEIADACMHMYLCLFTLQSVSFPALCYKYTSVLSKLGEIE